MKPLMTNLLHFDAVPLNSLHVCSTLRQLIKGEEFSFTPWGIVSGLFWVPGGVATVYAVKTSGLAIGIGVGSSFIVLVSFTWGIFIFGEHVHSKAGATLAVACMMVGLLGMSYFSAPTKGSSTTGNSGSIDNQADRSANGQHSYHELNSGDSSTSDGSAAFADVESEIDVATDGLSTSPTATTTTTGVTSESASSEAATTDNKASNAQAQQENDTGTPVDGDAENDGNEEGVVLVEMENDGIMREEQNASGSQSDSHVSIFGFMVPRYYTGVAASAFCGIWGGSIMVPMHWAPPDQKGSHYLISFAIGASTINILLWVIRYAYLVGHHRSMGKAYYALPSFHLGTMWLPGGASGMLWSIGNFCSIVSVEYLGEGVGYSVVQASMLVSGLWGIFYFREIKGISRISCWFLSGALTVFGILSLSYEHGET
uniref:EamA domain-containing protein n=1 Tax=Craspedostauros australis TaxID=1486917 RepID=A0A6T6DR75_9STRA|mmetsp:Transcript_10195/g.27962  ORF Transcript_10195/g.27962 Transcript_10195/m.27962 type:complete len:428 (+) Transcript_10195:895-2178(+)